MNNSLGTHQRKLPLDLDDEQSEFQVWRPIHYLGSKLRLTDAIGDLVNQLDPAGGAVCDLFAGSGTVSLSLSQARSVVAADIQEYSRVLCTALLQPGLVDDALASRILSESVSGAFRSRAENCLSPILEFEQAAISAALNNPEKLCALVEGGSLLAEGPTSGPLSRARRLTTANIEREFQDEPFALLATRYFGGAYFSLHQSLTIDCVLHAIAELDTPARTLCLAALLSTASNIVNSVGKQFAQPMRPRRRDGTIKSHLIRQMLRDRCQDASDLYGRWLGKYRAVTQSREHRVVCDDYRSVLASLTDVSVIYADPPYTRDHYSRFYHVLETLCLSDNPAVSTRLLTGEGKSSRGVYRTDRHQSPFCIKSKAPQAFDELIEGSRNANAALLMSYSPFIKDGHPRLMTVDNITSIAKRYYRSVEVLSAGLTHSKLNKNELHLNAASEAEVFISCRI